MNAQTKIEPAAATAVPAVYTAISDVMLACSKEGLSKDRKNQQQNYQFRGIDDVYNLLCGILAENRLVILPDVEKMEREERQTQKGGVITYTILTVRFKLVSAIDGSFDYVRTVGEAMDTADKSANKAQSAAMKYAELQVFQIPTEGDNDADATTHTVAPRQQSHHHRGEPLISRPQWAKITDLLKVTGAKTKVILDHYDIADLQDLTDRQAIKVINQLEDKLAEMTKSETNRAGETDGNSNNDTRRGGRNEGGRGGSEFGDIDDSDVPF